MRRVAAPFQRYGGPLRAAQGYLTKMPEDFVAPWPDLRLMADAVASMQDVLAPLAEVVPPADAGRATTPKQVPFRLKSDREYLAVVGASVQRRTRNHERLVRHAGGWLQARGALVSTPHPIDLFVAHPLAVILEAKLVQPRGALAAIREAVGQLHEHRFSHGPREAEPCVLLDRAPSPEQVAYVEGYLSLLIAWWTSVGLAGGPLTATCLSGLGVRSG